MPTVLEAPSRVCLGGAVTVLGPTVRRRCGWAPELLGVAAALGVTVLLGGRLFFGKGVWTGVLGAVDAAGLGAPALALFSLAFTLKLLNLLQHGLIRSDRAFLNNDLSQLLSQFFDGVVVVVPQVCVLGHVRQGRIEVGT